MNELLEIQDCLVFLVEQKQSALRSSGQNLSKGRLDYHQGFDKKVIKLQKCIEVFGNLYAERRRQLLTGNAALNQNQVINQED